MKKMKSKNKILAVTAFAMLSLIMGHRTKRK